MIDVEAALTDLAQHVRWPDEERPIRRQPRWVELAAAVLLLLVVATIVPATRERVTAFFGIGGVEVGRGVMTDPAERSTLGSVFAGEVTFRLPAALGEPTEVRRDAEGRFWLVYPPSRLAPEGALLAVFEHGVDGGLTKLARDPSSQVTQVELDRGAALWVEGDDHFILFEGSAGRIVEDRGRLSGPALIWTEDDLTYRLEAVVDREAAIEIAKS